MAGNHLEDVFEALCRLSGTEAPAREFFQNTLLWYGPQWDDSFDAFIHYLADKDHSWRAEMALLVEPLCLLDRIRTLEEKHSRLLEEIHEQNKRLKKKLERMTV